MSKHIISYQSISFPFGNYDAETVGLIKSGLQAGDNDFYICEAPKAILTAASVFNPNPSTVQLKAQIKVGEDVIRVQNGNGLQSVSSNGIANISLIIVLLNQGDIFSLNCSAAGLNLIANVVEFDGLVPLQREIFQLIEGDNTVLEAEGDIFPLYGNLQYNLGLGSVALVNETGLSLTFKGYLKKQGSDPVLLRQNANQQNNSLDGGPQLPFLATGDQVIINSNSSSVGQYGFMTYYEKY